MIHNPNPILLIRLFFWLGCILGVVVSLAPTEHLPTAPLFNFPDKALHGVAFMGLCMIGSWAYPHRSYSLILGLMVLGGAIEIAQFTTEWHHMSSGDFVANSVGIVIGRIGYNFLHKRKSTLN